MDIQREKKNMMNANDVAVDVEVKVPEDENSSWEGYTSYEYVFFKSHILNFQP